MIILNRGTEQDPSAHKLYTGRNQYVPNERPDAERSPESLREARKIVRRISPSAICRSLTSRYNCMGMVFAFRRTIVDVEHIRTFLTDDGYSKVSRNQVIAGDIVVYVRDGKAQHVGLIHRLEDVSLRQDRSMIDVWVLSQWGEDGEYLHKIDEVPLPYGKAFEYWSERTPE